MHCGQRPPQVNDMKNLGRCITALLLLGLMLAHCASLGQIQVMAPDLGSQSIGIKPLPPPPPEPPITNGGESLPDFDVVEAPRGEFRGVWVASVLNLDFPSRQGLSTAAMKWEIDTTVARSVELGLNAIVFQVRPTGDAMYQSDIFPWSHWLSGAQGEGIADFDPLAYWIEAAHANGLELHAWLNPYRIIHTQSNSSSPDTLAPSHPVRLRPELAVPWADSNGNRGLFLDPGLPEARELIMDGVAEIVRNYDVDGIHIDDYFYPGTNFDDSASFAIYGGDMELADWRRENVNQTIRGIQAVIHELNAELDKNVRWGVSPTAIWMNESNNPLGVPTTRGQESYNALYADTRLWVVEGWVDYICPQIYWYIGFGTADFEAVLNWWIDLCGDYNVDLYIGHATYREVQDDQPPHWRGEIIRQLGMAADSDVVKGSVFYRFHSMIGAVGNSIRDFYAQIDDLPVRQPAMSIETLSVGSPHEDTSIAASTSASVGFHITGTSVPGIPLFMNGNLVANRTDEGFFSVFPYLAAGANVFTFSQEGHEDVIRTITRNSPSPGGTTSPPTPAISTVATRTYATVTSDAAWVFPSNSASGGSDWMMQRNQVDRVIAESSNGLVRLSCGMWINRDHVSISTQGAFDENALKDGIYRAGADHDVIAWDSDVFTAAYAGFDGRVLTVNFGMHSQPPPLALPDDLSETVFESVRSGVNGNTPFYAFTIRNDIKFEGYHIEYGDGEFRIHLKKRKTVAEGDKPLNGIKIVLDPGHGGTESGAIGPMGYAMAEKDLNIINSLNLARRLDALGADVHLTRDSDVSITLQERVDLAWQVKPDLFISLHINSVSETTNASNVRGFTVWYRNPGSVEFSQTILDFMYYINPATNRNRNLNQANFFVCRPQWTPSVLLEAGFIVNIDDFAWLIDPAQQGRMADATVISILEYFAP